MSIYIRHNITVLLYFSRLQTVNQQHEYLSPAALSQSNRVNQLHPVQVCPPHSPKNFGLTSQPPVFTLVLGVTSGKFRDVKGWTAFVLPLISEQRTQPRVRPTWSWTRAARWRYLQDKAGRFEKKHAWWSYKKFAKIFSRCQSQRNVSFHYFYVTF